MRLMFFSNVHPHPLSPGKGTFNGALVRALAAEQSVHVVCPVSWCDQAAAWWRTGEKLPSGLQVIGAGLTARFPTFWYPPKLGRAHFDRWLAWSVGKVLDRDAAQSKPQAVLAYWAHPDGAVAVQAARRWGVPCAVMVGGSDVLLLARQGARRRAILDVLQQADAVMGVSADIIQRLEQDGVPAEKLHVVRRGVDSQLFYSGSQQGARQKTGLATDKQIIVGVGRLVSVKAWDVLIEACNRLKQQGLNFACHILGDGPLRGELTRLIAARQLEQHVFLSGAKPQAELAEWYRAADLVALASHSEGVPNVLLEALACGTPFVATNVGGIPEIADPHEHPLVPPGNPDALAEALQRRLQQPRPSSPPVFQPWTWQASAQRIVEILKNCGPAARSVEVNRTLELVTSERS